MEIFLGLCPRINAGECFSIGRDERPVNTPNNDVEWEYSRSIRFVKTFLLDKGLFQLIISTSGQFKGMRK